MFQVYPDFVFLIFFELLINLILNPHVFLVCCENIDRVGKDRFRKLDYGRRVNAGLCPRVEVKQASNKC